ncbi:MAG: hypothetical protein L0221_18225, partial [Chloroflexi bacterium]|nr:hypothetical protein [Chloroflexota bacterium]
MPQRAAILAILGACALGAAVSAHGATFNVTTTADTGAGSLRQAVLDANDSSDASDTIAFSSSLAGSTIVLASPLETIATETLIFDATSSPGLTINGGGTTFLTNTGTSTSTRFMNVSYANGSTDFLFYQLTLEESGSGLIDGDLFADDFTLIKTGAGITTLPAGRTIDLTGLFDNSDVQIAQGTFAVLGTLNAATVLVETQGTLTVGGTVDTATLQSQGALTVNGTLIADTVDAQGPLTANGNITAATLLIGSAGTLAGDSDVSTIAADVTVEGRVTPSTTSGHLRINGDLAFASASVLDVDLLPGNAGDRIDAANGTVSVAPGAQLVFRAQPSDFAAAETATVIAADAPVSGSFALATDYAFLDESLDLSDPNKVQIRLAPNGLSLASFAFTPNQSRVAQHLADAAPGASGDLADALDAIQDSTTADVTPLLDALGGESLTAFATARQILAERTARALHRRARDASWGDGRAFYLAQVEALDVAADGDAGIERDRVRPGAWLDGLGLFGELEGERGEAEL